jgi:hypothetical protein
MRKLVWLGIYMLTLGFGTGIASADVIAIGITGHVTQVSDSSLGVTVGQAITATYSYDSSTPASGTGADGGTTYLFASPPAAIAVYVAGGPTYLGQSTWIYQSDVANNSFFYTVTSPASGGSSTAISIAYFDPTSVWLSGQTLPTTAPPQAVLSGTSGGAWPPYINVQPAGSSGFVAQIDTAVLAPSITVSPANSSFISQQSFDAAVLLFAQSSVTSMQASVNGTPIGFSYPGTCQLAAANNTLHTALICPSASTVLAGLGGGPVTINWVITLADGSTLQQSVIWNLVL